MLEQQSKSHTTKRKKKKGLGLTDKQRAKEAHAHWIIHHGKSSDAVQFMAPKANTNNVSAETIAALTLMTTNPFEQ